MAFEIFFPRALTFTLEKKKSCFFCQVNGDENRYPRALAFEIFLVIFFEIFLLMFFCQVNIGDHGAGADAAFSGLPLEPRVGHSRLGV